MTYALVFLAAYLIGSIPFGYLLSRLTTLDVKKRTVLTLLLEGTQGWFAMIIGMYGLYIDLNNPYCPPRYICLIEYPTPITDGFSPLADSEYFYLFSKFSVFSSAATLGVLCGCIFPVWLKFKGSKGVATYIGALSSIQILQLPLLGLVACGTWLATALVFRIASLASLMMMLVTTAFALMTGFGIPVAFMSFLVLYSHKDNIKRLFNGTEPKIWQKKEESQP